MNPEKLLTRIFPASGYAADSAGLLLNLPLWTMLLTLAALPGAGWFALAIPVAMPLMAHTLRLYVPDRRRLVFWTTVAFGFMLCVRPQVYADVSSLLRLLLSMNMFYALSRGVALRGDRRLSLFLAAGSALALAALYIPLLQIPSGPHALGISWWKFHEMLPEMKLFYPVNRLLDGDRNFYLCPDEPAEFLRLFTLRYTAVNLLVVAGLAMLLWRRVRGERGLAMWLPTGLFLPAYGLLFLFGWQRNPFLLPVMAPLFPLLFVIAAQLVSPFRVADIDFGFLAGNGGRLRKAPGEEKAGVPKWGYPLLFGIISLYYALTICSMESLRTYDSISYLMTWENFRAGLPDAVRTPLYPLFIGLCRSCFGESYLYGIAAIQFLAVLGAVQLFRRLASRFIESPRLVFWATAVTFLNPDVATFTGLEMTEIFSLVAVLLFADPFVRSLRSGRVGPVMECMLWSIVMIALKPGLLWVLPLEVLVWPFVIFTRRSPRFAVAAAVAVALPAMLLAAYAAPIKEYYGTRSFSYISTINNMTTLVSLDVADAESCSDPVLRRKLEEINGDSVRIHSDPLSHFLLVTEQWGLVEYPLKERFRAMDNYADSLMKEHIGEIPGFVWRRAALGLPNNRLIHTRDFPGWRAIGTIVPYMGAVTLLLLILFPGTAVWQAVRQRRRVFTRGLLCAGVLFCVPWGMYMANWLESLISGYIHWSRLNLDVWPLLVIIFFQLLSLLKTKPDYR